MFEGILQLMPAHTLLLTSEGGGEPSCYWDVHVNPDVSSSEPYEAVAERLHCVLHEATRIHLRSDVPVGTCLSGGIDSSTLSVLINRIIREEGPASVGSRQKTFSAVFSDKRFDESRFIDEIVAATGVDSHKVEPNPEDLWEDIARLVRMQDEPFGSLSIYAQYCVMRTASRQVKVVLDGQGADELLGGYLAYQASYIGGLLRQFHIWTSWGEIFGSLSRHRGFFTSAFGQLFRRRKRRGLLCIEGSRVNRYGGSLDSVLKRELMATNLPALLHYEDRNSMAFSIESRVPYLDVNVVEYIASLPADQKIRRGVTKYCLRNAIRGIVPDAIRCRMDKMGFVTPEEVWMREDLRPFMLDLFSSASFHSRRFWNADAVIRDYLDFIAGKTRYSPEIWRIACTELWLREFFDRRTSSTG
jgi:asparagine synthase (glutamine-hydrolysing)